MGPRNESTRLGQRQRCPVLLGQEWEAIDADPRRKSRTNRAMPDCPQHGGKPWSIPDKPCPKWPDFRRSDRAGFGGSLTHLRHGQDVMAGSAKGTTAKPDLSLRNRLRFFGRWSVLVIGYLFPGMRSRRGCCMVT